MQEILNLISGYDSYIILGLLGITILLFILLVINMYRINKLKKRYETFMIKQDVDLESLLINYSSKVNETVEIQEKLQTKVNELDQRIKDCSQKVGVVRYNALDNTAGELSFAVAVLDDYNNGVVINGIYSRNGSYTYAKEIKDAKSSHSLSEEEQQAIQKAIQSKH